MNQILYTNKNNCLNENVKIKKNFFTIQLVISITLIITTIIIYLFYLYTINKKETLSYKLTNNYNISKLYNNENNSSINTYINNGTKYSVIGLIEIPKIALYYPILSDTNDDLLKISPCKFYGPNPNEFGNLCIVGHNYDNYKFFSRINTLNINDEIIIYDIDGNSLSYFITDNFEVSEDETNKVIQSDNNIKQVTLITCNNINSNRIIIKAKSESYK